MLRLFKKIGPIIYALFNIHHMIKECFFIPYYLINQERDWINFNRMYYNLSSFDAEKEEIKKLMSAPHQDYITNFSAPLISLSLNRAIFFYFFNLISKPKIILDLGSGFSSFVFRKYANEHTETKVITIDDSSYWLNETSQFLSKYNLSIEEMHLLDEFPANNLPEFDLTFLDIGNLSLRMELLPHLIEKIKVHRGAILIDDFHVPYYRKAVIGICNSADVQIFSLRKVTRTRLSYNALIIN